MAAALRALLKLWRAIFEMKVSILCSSPDHPVNDHLDRWVSDNEGKHVIQIARRKEELLGGDILFLISCSEIVRETERQMYESALVIHASDLPAGRGWSPHIWSIINGVQDIVVTLLEAEDKVDSGAIWHKIPISISADLLSNEINNLLFDVELELMDFALDNFDQIQPYEQDSDIRASYNVKRIPEDSRIDLEKNIKSQFDLMRVCDPVRFPAFFELHGHKYFIRLEKSDD
jgi:methionyl-tRNA formyltransferase